MGENEAHRPGRSDLCCDREWEFRKRLSDPDTAVIRSAIRAIDEIGRRTISTEDDLRKIVDANVDRELSQAAAAAIRRITAP